MSEIAKDIANVILGRVITLGRSIKKRSKEMIPKMKQTNVFAECITQLINNYNAY